MSSMLETHLQPSDISLLILYLWFHSRICPKERALKFGGVQNANQLQRTCKRHLRPYLFDKAFFFISCDLIIKTKRGPAFEFRLFESKNYYFDFFLLTNIQSKMWSVVFSAIRKNERKIIFLCRFLKISRSKSNNCFFDQIFVYFCI